jgi:CubicO group peptidase (beta-lactamase class C family)
MSFEEYMKDTFFDPLNMSRSTYNYIASIENNAGSYDRDGQAAPMYKYASSAATGFATSGSDLTKFVIAQIPNSNSANILDQSTIETMREPHGKTLGLNVWGLGTILYSATRGNDFLFGHDGGNDPAINSTARINPKNGDAIIVLETGHPSLATNIGSHWVLWQTGYPDVLDSDSTIESMYVPFLIGLLLILVAAIYIGFRRSRQT